MPEFSIAQIRRVCRARVAQSPWRAEKLERRAVAVVAANQASGRLGRLLRAGQSGPQRSSWSSEFLKSYVDRVITELVTEGNRVESLTKGEPSEWDSLRQLLTRRASKACSRRYDPAQAQQQAEEFASETCMIIFEQPYPFDVAFDAWATTILNNLIRARYTRSTDALDRGGRPDSLDAPASKNGEIKTALGELIADLHSSAPFETIEEQEMLLGAIRQLPSREQERVIVHTYFDDMSVPEIARQMSKSPQAIYNLRNRALSKLRDILK